MRSGRCRSSQSNASYADPTRLCDIVMKGGITSGVVYPLAVCELARTFRFKSVGGTSAGAIALLLTLVPLAIAVRAVMTGLREFPANFYGLCTGNGPATETRRPALTPWMSQTINRYAGMPEQGPPLTFGDLWGHRDPTASQRDLNLQVMTANLTNGRGHRIRFVDQRLYFDPSEFRRLFPETVVQWTIDHPRRGDDTEETADRYAPLQPLPDAADLPVVVAARMSLSFPLVVSAVPLQAIDYSKKVADEHECRPERCWLSDGGMISTFPVHFFDRPLPRWPTFPINLRGFHPDYPKTDCERDNVYLPATNRGGVRESWSRFDGLLGFLAAIKSASQNWLDNAQIAQPRLRDRIAHISLDGDEGGLNLTMPKTALDALSERGRWAGIRLCGRFMENDAAVNTLTWEDHWWVRYRTATAALEALWRA